MSRNRILSRSLRTIELNLVIVLGAAGAIQANNVGVTDNDGFDGTAPISSGGAGVYTLKLDKGAQRLMPGCSVEVKQAAAYSAAAACRANHIVDNVGAATPTVTFTIVNSAGAATQPAVGDILRVRLVVKI